MYVVVQAGHLKKNINIFPGFKQKLFKLRSIASSSPEAHDLLPPAYSPSSPLSPSSVTSCASSCQLTAGCVSFRWKESTGGCQLLANSYDEASSPKELDWKLYVCPFHEWWNDLSQRCTDVVQTSWGHTTPWYPSVSNICFASFKLFSHLSVHKILSQPLLGFWNDFEIFLMYRRVCKDKVIF